MMKAPESSGAKIDAQLSWIFSRLTEDMRVWKRLTSKYQADIFVGLFLENKNRGISLSPDSMNELRRRKLSIGFDIYCP